MRVLHVLASNKYSGAENVVCQIIDAFKNEVEMAYCSLNGEIRNTLTEKQVQFCPMSKFSLKELKRVVDEFTPDIIHAHDVKASIIASRLHKNYKIVSHIHGNDKRNMGKITLKSLIYKMCLKNIDKVLLVSKSCLDEFYFKKSLENKCEILYNVINVENLYKTIENEKVAYDYDICYLGRLAEVKNPLRTLKIMKSCVDFNRNIKCALIGDGELMDSCQQYIVENKLEKNIELLGFQSCPHKFVKDAKVLLMSSINEGTPMCALEALALGVPLVSTKTDGMVDLIENDKNGYLYDEDDQAIKFITKLIDDKNMQQVIRKNCLEFSSNYNDIEKYKDKLKKIYTE